MTLYEGMFLLDPADVAHDWDGLQRHVTDLISKSGGDLVYSEKWPDRRLAYEIKGRRKGVFFLTYFHAAGDGVSQLRHATRLSERILRLMVIKKDHAMPEVARRREAQEKGTILAPAEPELRRGRPGGGRYSSAPAPRDEEFGKDEAPSGSGAATAPAAEAPAETPPAAQPETPPEKVMASPDAEPTPAADDAVAESSGAEEAPLAADSPPEDVSADEENPEEKNA